MGKNLCPSLKWYFIASAPPVSFLSWFTEELLFCCVLHAHSLPTTTTPWRKRQPNYASPPPSMQPLLPHVPPAAERTTPTHTTGHAWPKHHEGLNRRGHAGEVVTPTARGRTVLSQACRSFAFFANAKSWLRRPPSNCSITLALPDTSSQQQNPGAPGIPGRLCRLALTLGFVRNVQRLQSGVRRASLRTAPDGYHAERMLFEEDKTAALRPDPLWDKQRKKSQKGSLKLSAPLWKNQQCC